MTDSGNVRNLDEARAKKQASRSDQALVVTECVFPAVHVLLDTSRMTLSHRENLLVVDGTDNDTLTILHSNISSGFMQAYALQKMTVGQWNDLIAHVQIILDAHAKKLR